MSNKTPKSTDSLMRYLRDKKNISISGSTQKRKLMNIGYYHGYKGYRYIQKATNIVPYSNFNELVAIYDFDTQMKALFYPCVMQIETALKNYALEVIVHSVNSDSFINIYNNLLDNYKSFSLNGKFFQNPQKRKDAEDKYNHALEHRLHLRNRIYKVQTDAFANRNKIATHYLCKDSNLPIWAIFELLSLGEFGHFVSCLNYRCRQAISIKMGIRQSDDNNAMMPQRLIYAIKDLRNAIAHNDVVFDTRFRTGKIDKQVSNAILNETGVPSISFETISDYLILVVYLLSLIKAPKNEIKRVISTFVEHTERLRKSIPTNVYNQIIHTNNNSKIAILRKFI